LERSGVILLIAPVRHPGLTRRIAVPEKSEPGHVIVTAVQHVRSMRGGAQSHLMRCSNNKFYVVKFRNNPQGVRILANEFVFSNLAKMLGLSVPCPAIVEVSELLVQHSPSLNIRIPPNSTMPCDSGLQYGSEYAIDPLKGSVTDWLSSEMLMRTRNRSEFAGMFVLDKWACNLDSRQTVFWRRSIERKYSACFIDHGYCFGAEDWNFRDEPLRGAYSKNEVYGDITGWDSFDPWLSELERLDETFIWNAVSSTPPIWYLSDWSSIERLAETLILRRGKVRQLIEQFRDLPRHPFPRWGQDTEPNGRQLRTAASMGAE
jgi:hypothetical protein